MYICTLRERERLNLYCSLSALFRPRKFAEKLRKEKNRGRKGAKDSPEARRVTGLNVPRQILRLDRAIFFRDRYQEWRQQRKRDRDEKKDVGKKPIYTCVRRYLYIYVPYIVIRRVLIQKLPACSLQRVIVTDAIDSVYLISDSGMSVKHLRSFRRKNYAKDDTKSEKNPADERRLHNLFVLKSPVKLASIAPPNAQ